MRSFNGFQNKTIEIERDSAFQRHIHMVDKLSIVVIKEDRNTFTDQLDGFSVLFLIGRRGINRERKELCVLYHSFLQQFTERRQQFLIVFLLTDHCGLLLYENTDARQILHEIL